MSLIGRSILIVISDFINRFYERRCYDFLVVAAVFCFGFGKGWVSAGAETG